MMKRMSVLFFVLGLALSAPVYADQVEVDVHGVACSFCTYGLEKKVKAMEGVRDIKVDVTKGKALIEVDDAKKMNYEQLEEEIKAAGLEYKGHQVVKVKTGHEG